MKYKVGDKVRVKSLDWYNECKNEYGAVPFRVKGHSYPVFLSRLMSNLCGQLVTIDEVLKDGYYIKEDNNNAFWIDDMFENDTTDINGVIANAVAGEMLAEKTILDMILTKGLILPKNYEFKDENGNIINATKIVLEKKKKEYPKTYAECSDILSVYTDPDISGYKGEFLWAFQKLLLCRDAYWKIAGEEMGLGKPWEANWETLDKKYNIYNYRGTISYDDFTVVDRCVLVFPTAEMRDAFYENFKKEIKMCKELL